MERLPEDEESEDERNQEMIADVYRINRGGETMIVEEASRIKKEIEANTDKASVVLLEPLNRLLLLSLSVETLNDTHIGFSVRRLKKHSSKRVRVMATLLTRRWRDRVDEWVNQVIESQRAEKENSAKMEVTKAVSTTSSVVVMKDATTPKRILKLKLKSTSKFAAAGSKEKLRDQIHGAMQRTSTSASAAAAASGIVKDEKLEDKIKASKRKLKEGYKIFEDARKRRKIQVLELKDLPCSEKLDKPKAHVKGRARFVPLVKRF